MENYYKGIIEKPFHLSVGAVLVNNDNKVACHYFKQFQFETDLEMYEDSYILMRETLEQGESLEEAVLRGIEEEFGAKGKIINYIGSIKSQFYRVDVSIEKTTLYFLVKLKEYDLSKRLKEDEEKLSEIQWQSLDFLIAKMEEQGKKYQRTDLDESVVLKRAKMMI